MARTKSAKKRARQSEERRERNRSVKSRTKNAIRKIRELINAKKVEEAKKLLPEVISLIDKASSKGVWHKNKSAREKSRLMRSLQG
ncbi:30S ribosomal protein S20 [Candidatus Aerophobetes bacterium]|nr:30S ribosomal protein S20 [Candidatus Aerophobetes bacterium]HHJ00620.1 30S ribosomal protein S20 [Candidatus Aerophobetes bacterium]